MHDRLHPIGRASRTGRGTTPAPALAVALLVSGLHRAWLRRGRQRDHDHGRGRGDGDDRRRDHDRGDRGDLHDPGRGDGGARNRVRDRGRDADDPGRHGRGRVAGDRLVGREDAAVTGLAVDLDRAQLLLVLLVPLPDPLQREQLRVLAGGEAEAAEAAQPDDAAGIEAEQAVPDTGTTTVP